MRICLYIHFDIEMYLRPKLLPKQIITKIVQNKKAVEDHPLS